ncbi:MAG TPA: acyl-CoA dehydrogenase family protein [Clostridia bacterium]|nr:acyl-CoA dehydrogenase family protein [Clostridia bacterium]
MDFTLSPSHELLKNLYKKFAEEEVKPLAHDMDEAEAMSMELVQKMQALGFFGIPYPREYGGAGADTLAYALCMEEISKADASTGITISVHTSLICSSIYEYGSETQKQEFLRPLLDGRKIGCFCLTEPNAGSDASGIQSFARREGDGYILNGSKVFTTNSGFADTMLVFAYTDKAMGTDGISAFILDAKSKGVYVSANIPRMGIRAASNCEVAFQNVYIPASNLLKKEGMGFEIAMKALDGGRIGIGAQAVGIAQGALNAAIEYVKERKQFGKPISSFQNSKFKLAEMQTKIDAARLLVWRAAMDKDAHRDYGSSAAMCKLFASEVANDVTRGCVQLFGGYGYCREYPVERMMRDAKITEIYEGTSEVMKMVISNSIRVR